jgi:xylulose-5-phosphate/fructose-6-phosphate phosphoketolase
VIDRVPGLGSKVAGFRQRMVDARLAARQYTREHGEDVPEVRDWVWPDAGDTATSASGPQYDAATSTGGDNE